MADVRDNAHYPTNEEPSVAIPSKADFAAFMQAELEAAMNAPSMFERDVAYWDEYMGGPTPDELLPHNWSDEMKALAQPQITLTVDTDLCIASLRDEFVGGERERLRNALRSRQSYADAFVKFGHRTAKDCATTVFQWSEAADVMANSERAMEELAIAKAKGMERFPITFRPTIEVDDAREVRVFVRDGKVHAVSTGPYASHHRTDALAVWMACRDVATEAARLLPIEAAWIDVFEHDGRAYLCDINPARPTTWPGHFHRLFDPSSGVPLEEQIVGHFAYTEAKPVERLIGVDVPGLPDLNRAAS